MSEEKIDRLLEAAARTEVHTSVIRRDLTSLKDDTNKRLRSHAEGLRSLNKTRDRQFGAGKVISVLVTLIGVVIGWALYDG